MKSSFAAPALPEKNDTVKCHDQMDDGYLDRCAKRQAVAQIHNDRENARHKLTGEIGVLMSTRSDPPHVPTSSGLVRFSEQEWANSVATWKAVLLKTDGSS